MSKTAEELQAELDLLREQEAALAAKEAEVQAAKEAITAEVVVPEPEAAPAAPYREHGRMGVDSGSRS